MPYLNSATPPSLAWIKFIHCVSSSEPNIKFVFLLVMIDVSLTVAWTSYPMVSLTSFVCDLVIGTSSTIIKYLSLLTFVTWISSFPLFSKDSFSNLHLHQTRKDQKHWKEQKCYNHMKDPIYRHFHWSFQAFKTIYLFLVTTLTSLESESVLFSYALKPNFLVQM